MSLIIVDRLEDKTERCVVARQEEPSRGLLLHSDIHDAIRGIRRSFRCFSK